MRVSKDEVKNRAQRISDSLGQLEQAKSGKLTSAESLKFVRLKTLDPAKGYAEAVRASQQRSAIFKNQALIFVHGYNNTFEGAVQRATQVSFDLQFDGILMPFMWPSQATTLGYPGDAWLASRSVDALVGFLDHLRRSLPKIKIHFLAHSMGNQVMLRALCKIAKRDGQDAAAKHNFGQVISAHADVSHSDFEELTKCFEPRVEGITLYVNQKDTALRVRCVGFRCRAGNAARAYSAADVIDTTALGKGFIRTLTKGFDHDVFVRNPLLFGDITRLLLTGQRPVEKRTPEFQSQKDSEGGTYWAYDKSLDPLEQPVEGHTPSVRSVAISARKDPARSGAVLWGHKRSVMSVAALPDGRLVSGAGDETVRVWTQKGSRWPAAVLTGHSDTVMSVAALPDGRLVSGSKDKTLRVWTQKDGAWSATVLKGHSDSVYSVAALPDGRFVSGSYDKTVRVWAEKDGAWTGAVLKGHRGPVRTVAALPDGRLISGSSDRSVRVWTKNNGAWTVTILKGHRGPVWSVAALPDGRLVSGSSDKTVRVWTQEDGDWSAAVLKGHSEAVMSVAALPDGRLVSGAIDNTLQVWTQEDGEWSAAVLKGHTGMVMSVAALPDGRLVSGASDETVRVWANTGVTE